MIKVILAESRETTTKSQRKCIVKQTYATRPADEDCDEVAQGRGFSLESFLKASAGDPVCANDVHDETTVWTGKLIRAQAPSIEGKCRPGP